MKTNFSRIVSIKQIHHNINCAYGHSVCIQTHARCSLGACYIVGLSKCIIISHRCCVDDFFCGLHRFFLSLPLLGALPFLYLESESFMLLYAMLLYIQAKHNYCFTYIWRTDEFYIEPIDGIDGNVDCSGRLNLFFVLLFRCVVLLACIFFMCIEKCKGF